MPQTQPQSESRQANRWHIVSGANEICSDIAVCGHSVVTTATVFHVYMTFYRYKLVLVL